jgi:uncharacterized protein YggU (UPF0235/DUF167 family)
MLCIFDDEPCHSDGRANQNINKNLAKDWGVNIMKIDIFK